MIIRSLFACIFLKLATIFFVACDGPVPAQPRRTLPQDVVEFHILASKKLEDHKTLDMISTAFLAGGPDAVMPKGFRWFPVRPVATPVENTDLVNANWNGRKYILAKTVLTFSLDNRTAFQVIHFEKEEVKPPFGWILHLDLDKEGAAQIKQITAKNVDRSLGFFLRGELVLHASIRESVDSGRLSLSSKPETIEAIYNELLKVSPIPADDP